MTKYVLAKVVYNDVSGVASIVKTADWDLFDPIIMTDTINDMAHDMIALRKQINRDKDKYLKNLLKEKA